MKSVNESPENCGTGGVLIRVVGSIVAPVFTSRICPLAVLVTGSPFGAVDPGMENRDCPVVVSFGIEAAGMQQLINSLTNALKISPD